MVHSEFCSLYGCVFGVSVSICGFFFIFMSAHLMSIFGDPTPDSSETGFGSEFS